MVYQQTRQLHLRLGVVKVGSMDQLSSLALDGLNQVRMTMPQYIDGNPTDKIEVFSSFQIVDLRASAPYDRNRLAIVGLHQVFGGIIFQLVSRHDDVSP